jgi:hypothetical protein
MLRTTRMSAALFLVCCIVGCDSAQTTPRVACPQPQPACAPYQPTSIDHDTTIQVASRQLETVR